MAGIDDGIQARIDFSGAKQEFLSKLVNVLSSAVDEGSGKSLLITFLGSLKGSVGIDQGAILDRLIGECDSSSTNILSSGTILNQYLDLLIDNWESRDSPLLPPEVFLSEVAVSLTVSEINSDAHPGPLSNLSGYQRITLQDSHHRQGKLMEYVDSLSDIRRWLVLGDPGSGKSTLLSREVALMAKEVQEGRSSVIPAFIELAAYCQDAVRNGGYSIFDYFETVGRAVGSMGFGEELRMISETGKLILFIDGLDEVPENIRKSSLGNISKAISKKNVIVCSSRKVGVSLPKGYRVLQIEPLSIEQQRKLMIAICGEEKTAILLRYIARRNYLKDMASVPMTLSLLSLIAREPVEDLEGYLKRQSDLFRLGSQILLEGRHRMNQGVLNPEKAELVLSRISLWLHEYQTNSGYDEVFPSDIVEKSFEGVDEQWISSWQGHRHFITDVSDRSNIIHSIDALKREYRYLHRTFREYFAALEISKMAPERRMALISDLVKRKGWEEVLVLLGGITPELNQYLEELLNGPDDLTLRALKEAKEIESDLAIRALKLKVKNTRERRQLFTGLRLKMKHDALVDACSSYINDLAGDIPRFDVYFILEILSTSESPKAARLRRKMFSFLPEVPDTLFTPIQLTEGEQSYWCRIPGGNFIMGAEIDDPERPAWVPVNTEIFVPELEIARVPVTNKLYEIFDPGHFGRRNFTDEVETAELDNHPAAGMSWYEAEVFCCWLRQKYPDVRLPNEYEWEKAASWTADGKKCRFPWGNEWDPKRLNSWHNGPNRTTPVGAFPNGASPCGALDMAGNVWEWCADWFEENYDSFQKRLSSESSNPNQLERGERKVDRGGGWYHDVGMPCTFMRAADDPADVFSHCGFRLARSVDPL